MRASYVHLVIPRYQERLAQQESNCCATYCRSYIDRANITDNLDTSFSSAPSALLPDDAHCTLTLCAGSPMGPTLTSETQ